MGKHLEQALPSVYTLQCLTGKVDNNNDLEIFTHYFFPDSVVHVIPDTNLILYTHCQGTLL